MENGIPDAEAAGKLDELLAHLEWLRVDQARKGALKHLETLSAISDRVEGLSRRLSGDWEREAPGPKKKAAAGDEAPLPTVPEENFPELLSRLEEAVRRMTGNRVVVESRDLLGIGEILDFMENHLERCLSGE